jgi:hypothetical protein
MLAWQGAATIAQHGERSATLEETLSGTGRVNVSQGAVMTVPSLDAALSPAVGGAALSGWANLRPS